MSARDELAELLAVTDHPHLQPPWKERADRSPVKFYSRKKADVLLAAGYRKTRTITTAEEMDALRFQSVVLDAYGTPYVCERHATDGTRNQWKPAGMGHLEESEDILYHGPATVVHEPTTEEEPTK